MKGAQTALVTGATGAVGPLLVHELARRGYKTRVLVRKTAPPLFPDSVQLFSGSLEDPRIVADALTGVDVVFHLAAKLHIANPQPENSQESRKHRTRPSRSKIGRTRACLARCGQSRASSATRS